MQQQSKVIGSILEALHFNRDSLNSFISLMILSGCFDSKDVMLSKEASVELEKIGNLGNYIDRVFANFRKLVLEATSCLLDSPHTAAMAAPKYKQFVKHDIAELSSKLDDPMTIYNWLKFITQCKWLRAPDQERRDLKDDFSPRTHSEMITLLKNLGMFESLPAVQHGMPEDFLLITGAGEIAVRERILATNKGLDEGRVQASAFSFLSGDRDLWISEESVPILLSQVCGKPQEEVDKVVKEVLRQVPGTSISIAERQKQISKTIELLGITSAEWPKEWDLMGLYMSRFAESRGTQSCALVKAIGKDGKRATSNDTVEAFVEQVLMGNTEYNASANEVHGVAPTKSVRIGMVSNQPHAHYQWISMESCLLGFCKKYGLNLAFTTYAEGIESGKEAKISIKTCLDNLARAIYSADELVKGRFT